MNNNMINELKYVGEAEVSYNSGNVEANFLQVGDTPNLNGTWDLTYDWYRDNWKPDVVKEYVPYYVWPTYTVTEDKFGKAFAIGKMLLKSKMLNSRKLPDFIKLVEMIAGEI